MVAYIRDNCKLYIIRRSGRMKETEWEDIYHYIKHNRWVPEIKNKFEGIGFD